MKNPDHELNQFQLWAYRRIADPTAKCESNKGQRCYPCLSSESDECLQCFRRLTGDIV